MTDHLLQGAKDAITCALTRVFCGLERKSRDRLGKAYS